MASRFSMASRTVLRRLAPRQFVTRAPVRSFHSSRFFRAFPLENSQPARSSTLTSSEKTKLDKLVASEIVTQISFRIRLTEKEKKVLVNDVAEQIWFVRWTEDDWFQARSANQRLRSEELTKIELAVKEVQQASWETRMASREAQQASWEIQEAAREMQQGFHIILILPKPFKATLVYSTHLAVSKKWQASRSPEKTILGTPVLRRGVSVLEPGAITRPIFTPQLHHTFGREIPKLTIVERAELNKFLGTVIVSWLPPHDKLGKDAQKATVGHLSASLRDLRLSEEVWMNDPLQDREMYYERLPRLYKQISRSMLERQVGDSQRPQRNQQASLQTGQ
ncbi:hypothetical protein SUNI508_12909 [Seiridium unicorne]|uniref:Uncharacterized protein n=1 Tax=Seiridium unicorne TaxID=138068 RepID=A0ABR2VF24_9PEZI